MTNDFFSDILAHICPSAPPGECSEPEAPRSDAIPLTLRFSDQEARRRAADQIILTGQLRVRIPRSQMENPEP